MSETTSQPVQLFQPNPAPLSVTSESAVARASQEVQAAMVIAKKFPRDEAAAYNRIMRACKRPSLAEVACYAYPRGGTTVTGPSIRMAECLAQNWGNVDFGVVELSQENGESQVMAYAWDLETNTRQTKIFTVKHQRKAQGQIKTLDDPRDIYEMVANQGARRVRACILGVIPGDIVESAVAECEKTLKEGSKEPLADRARKMVSAFSEMGVTQGMIEQKIGHKIDAISEQEMVNLRRIYTSLKDGAAKREDFFATEAVKPKFDAPEPATATEPKEKEQAGTSFNYRKALDGLCKIGGIQELEVMGFAVSMGLVEESLGSFADVEHATPSALKHIYDAWQDISAQIKAARPKAGNLI